GPSETSGRPSLRVADRPPRRRQRSQTLVVPISERKVREVVKRTAGHISAGVVYELHPSLKGGTAFRSRVARWAAVAGTPASPPFSPVSRSMISSLERPLAFRAATIEPNF